MGGGMSGRRGRCLLERRLGIVHRRLNRSAAFSSTSRFRRTYDGLSTPRRMGRGLRGRVKQFGGAVNSRTRGKIVHACVRAVLRVP